MTEDQRRQVGREIRAQRMREFGSKSAAYTKAGLNSATWDRIEEGERVRPDRLIAAVKLLWPITGGDWEKIPGPEYQVTGPVFNGSWEDPEYIGNVEQWVMELQGRVERLEQVVGDLLSSPRSDELTSDDFDLASRNTGQKSRGEQLREQQDRDAEE